MSAFGGLIMTNRGRILQTKAQTGVQLTFTRIALGDGRLSGQSILELNQLINEKKSVSITKLKTQPDGKAAVGAVLSNQDITTGFYWREIGVFAQDPDIGEILYCYGNAGSAAEYIPAGGGSDIIEKNIDIITIVGNASSVSATINQSLVFETPEGAQEKVDAHANDTTKHITEAERIAWNSKADQNHTHAFSDITGKPTTLAGYGITDAVSSSDVVSTPTANKILKLDANAKLPASITGNADGNAATASKLQTARTISLSGDVTGSASFDGSENATISATLTNSGVTPGTYPKVTVDEKGRVTEGQSLSASDIPNLDWSKITTGKPTTLAGYGITDAETPAGAQAKADQAETNAKAYADQKVSEHLADTTAHGIGDKSNLLTTSKDTIVSAINELFTSVSDGKMLLETTITGKGVTVSKSGSVATFNELNAAINELRPPLRIITLYDNGNEYESITGGFIKYNFDSSYPDGYFLKSSSYIACGDYITNGYNMSGFRTNNAIDFTGISRIYFDTSAGTMNGSPLYQRYIIASHPDYNVRGNSSSAASISVAASSTRMILTLDVSNLSGFYYIYCAPSSGAYADHTLIQYTYKIWMEGE